MKSDDPADDPFTLEALLLRPGLEVGTLASKPRARPAGGFVMVPMEWEHRLCKARCKATYTVALHLLFRVFKERRHPVIRLANGALVAKGVSAKQKWRALAELEEMGLIEVKHRPRKSPIVTVLYPGATA